KRAALWQGITDVLNERGEDLRWLLVNLRAVAQNRYAQIVDKLRGELGFFASSNVVVFGLLFLATFFMRGRYSLLILPALLLLASTIISVGIYAFGQNWFYVILFDHYMRYWYVAIDLAIFAFFVDWFMLRGRITANLLKVLTAIPVPTC